MRARAVPKEKLAAVKGYEWVDPQRRPYVDGDTAYVPVRDGFPCDRVLSNRKRYAGRGFYMLGDVAVIHGQRPSQDEVEKIVSFRHPEGVLWICSLHGLTRTPDTEVLYGEVREVRHHECGYNFVFDPRRVMFAQGNREEKRRIAGLVSASGRTERVADMFAGIGYFTIPMAGSGAMVHAMEINPIAFGYLQRNIAESGIYNSVQASCGDCRDLLSGTYDRIVMGHFDALTMLPHALRHVRNGSAIHLHSLGPVDNEIRSLVSGAGFSADIQVHNVKKYRPHIWHVVQDVIIT